MSLENVLKRGKGMLATAALVGTMAISSIANAYVPQESFTTRLEEDTKQITRINDFKRPSFSQSLSFGDRKTEGELTQLDAIGGLQDSIFEQSQEVTPKEKEIKPKSLQTKKLDIKPPVETEEPAMQQITPITACFHTTDEKPTSYTFNNGMIIDGIYISTQDLRAAEECAYKYTKRPGYLEDRINHVEQVIKDFGDVISRGEILYSVPKSLFIAKVGVEMGKPRADYPTGGDKSFSNPNSKILGVSQIGPPATVDGIKFVHDNQIKNSPLFGLYKGPKVSDYDVGEIRKIQLDPELNIHVGMAYMGYLLQRNKGNIGKTVVGYNAGMKVGDQVFKGIGYEVSLPVLRVYGKKSARHLLIKEPAQSRYFAMVVELMGLLVQQIFYSEFDRKEVQLDNNIHNFDLDKSALSQ